MRIVYPPGARTEFYDRNPIQIQGVYEARAIAPHAQTTRWTYTVPAGKKMYAGSLFCGIVCDTDQTGGGECDSSIAMTPSGGAVGGLLRASMAFSSTTTGRAEPAVGGGYFLAGDALLGRTEDLGTGGTISYLVSLQGTEFDA